MDQELIRVIKRLIKEVECQCEETPETRYLCALHDAEDVLAAIERCKDE